MARLRPHMRDDCIFRPPTCHGAWTGADETCLLLGTVSEVFGSSFRYGRQWLGEHGHEWALEFTTEVGAGSKKLLTGIDLVSLDEAGKIKEFTVLARPPNAVALLKDEMMRRVPMRLAAMKAKKAMGLFAESHKYFLNYYSAFGVPASACGKSRPITSLRVSGGASPSSSACSCARWT